MATNTQYSGPGIANIPVYHGDTLTFSLGIQDTNVNMIGHTILFQVRDKAGALIADWSEFAAINTPTQIDVVVPGDPDIDGTGKLPRPVRAQSYDYDFQLTSPIGTVRTILRGLMMVQGDVSHG